MRTLFTSCFLVSMMLPAAPRARAGAGPHGEASDERGRPTVVAPAEPVHPVKVSANRRYFVDQEGRPVFWLGTTQWELFRGYTLEEARTILRKSKDNGFAFVQVMLMGVGDGTKPNVHGEKPWTTTIP